MLFSLLKRKKLQLSGIRNILRLIKYDILTYNRQFIVFEPSVTKIFLLSILRTLTRSIRRHNKVYIAQMRIGLPRRSHKKSEIQRFMNFNI